MTSSEVLQPARRNMKKKKVPSSSLMTEDEHYTMESDNSTSQTRDTFKNLMHQVMQDDKYGEEVKKPARNVKKKKKIKSEQQEIMLERIRKGEGIRKDEEDHLFEANVYDPDDVKSKKSNKRRQLEQSNGTDNPVFENDDDKIVRISRKPKNTKSVSIEELAPETTEAQVHDKKKKTRPVRKKSRSPKREQETSFNASGELRTEDELSPKSGDESTSTANKKNNRRKKKVKKKNNEQGEDTLEAYAAALEDQEPSMAEPKEEEIMKNINVEDSGLILALTVHRTDRLKTDFNVCHPLVRVHVLDMETGQLMKKQTKERPVASYYEERNENVNMVLPILTQPFDFKKSKSTLPVWEELLIWNENFDYLIHPDSRVILFFEVLDFVSMNVASQRYNPSSQDGGWYKVAWGFLKLVGGNNKPNVDRRMRLQLYEPAQANLKTEPGQPLVYQWWRYRQRQPYPSTLYVTVKGVKQPDDVEPASRSMFATQREVGRMTFDELQSMLAGTSALSRDANKGNSPSPWTRLVGQTCKVPNTPYLSLSTGKNGCFVIKFSHDGKRLACACCDVNGYPIFIYEVPSGRLITTIPGHFSLVYELNWSADDENLLSASADGTVRLWDTVTLENNPLKVLPHPAYVYTAKFHARNPDLVVTGGYDHTIRVWYMGTKEKEGQLVQELIGHTGHVNSLCFDEEGSSLFSADNLGSVKIWNVFTTDQPSKRGILRDWTLKKELNEAELKGVSISNLVLHPNGRRLLLHCRDNTLRLLDLRVCAIMQRYSGALNYRDHLHSTFSPCGTFVVAGSEDNCAYVWNTETGDLVTKYTELNYSVPVSDVAYHPRDHMLAFCSFGEKHAIQVYKFDNKVARKESEFVMNPLSDLSPRRVPPQVDHLQTQLADFETAKTDMMSRETLRLQSVKNKLAAVTAFQAPASLSPHSQNLSLHQQQTQQMTASGVWQSPTNTGTQRSFHPSAQVTINMNQNKPEVAVQGPATSHKIKVIAIYDYHPQRSDELPLEEGMPVTVLYKDTANWWMGQLPSGQQGYFPSNYVTAEDDSLDDIEKSFHPESDDETKVVTSAVVTKSGELKFIAASEDEQQEPEVEHAQEETKPVRPRRTKKNRKAQQRPL